MIKTINRVRRILPRKAKAIRAMFAKGMQEYNLPSADRATRTQRRLIHHGVNSMLNKELLYDSKKIKLITQVVNESTRTPKQKANLLFQMIQTPKLSEAHRRQRVVSKLREVKNISGSKKARSILKRAGQIYFNKTNPWFKRP